MYKKICPECDSASYSSGKKGEWICPYCDEAYDNYKEIIKGE